MAWGPISERLASGSDDKTVKIWDSETGRLRHTLAGHEGAVLAVGWDVAGHRLAVATQAGTVDVWDLTGPEPRRLARFYEAPPLTGLVVTADGYVDGPRPALDAVRFRDGWALYDLDDLPERHSPERVREVLSRKRT